MFKWIGENLGTICTVLCGVIFVASIIVKATPSVKDNAILRKIIAFLDHFSVFQSADNKKTLDDAKKNLGE
ncbi:MAG: hypothetical protein ACTTJW_06375 [Sphaerochaeta sp.]